MTGEIPVRPSQALPLDAPATAERSISIESCRIDDERFQVRGSLVTTRVSYDRPETVERYQHIVVRLTLRFGDSEIVGADFAMPHGPFAGICDRLPIGAEALLGLHIGPGFRDTLRERFPRAHTCADLQALLHAMASLIPALGAMQGPFRRIDESLSASDVPAVFDAMVQRHKAAQTCHAWTNTDHGLPAHFARGDYGVVLTPIGRRVKRRWDAENE